MEDSSITAERNSALARHTVLRDLAQELRGVALARQAECHARGGEDTGAEEVAL